MSTSDNKVLQQSSPIFRCWHSLTKNRRRNDSHCKIIHIEAFFFLEKVNCKKVSVIGALGSHVTLLSPPSGGTVPSGLNPGYC